MQLAFRLIAVCLFPLSLVGCSGNEPTAAVTGTVTVDGKPLAEGTIIFEATGSRPATGKIKDGEIVEVFTYETDDGAPVGSHKVAISARPPASDAATKGNPGEAKKMDANYMGGGKSLIPTRYGDPSSSGLTATVEKGKENRFEFKLDSK